MTRILTLILTLLSTPALAQSVAGNFGGGVAGNTTVTGAIAANPTAALAAIGALPLTGGTLSGNLTLPNIVLNATSGASNITSTTAAGGNGNVFLQMPATTNLFRITGGGATIADFNAGGTSTINFYEGLGLQPDGTKPGQVWGFYMNNTWSGTQSTWAANVIQSVDNTVSTSPGGGSLLAINQIISSAAAQGVKLPLTVAVSVSGTSGNTSGLGGTYVAISGAAQGTVNDNGTSSGMGTLTGGKGSLWGLNTVAKLSSGATYWAGVNSAEFDVVVNSGASVNTKYGISIIELGGDVAQGQWIDNALLIGRSDTQASGKGWLHGLIFGNPQGYFPMDPTGTMIDAGPVSSGTMLAAVGIDFSRVNFSSYFAKSAGFTIDGSGNVLAASYKIASGTTSGNVVSFGASGAVSDSGVPLSNLAFGVTYLVTTTQTITVPTGWHSISFSAIGQGGGSGCGIVTTSGTASSGGGTGGTALPINDVFLASVTGGTSLTVTVPTANPSCVASGTTVNSTGSAPSAGGNVVLAVGTGSRTAWGGGAGSNGQSGAASAGGSGGGYCVGGSNASGSTAGGSSGCTPSSNAGGSGATGTAMTTPWGSAGGSGTAAGAVGNNGVNAVGAGPGGSGSGLAATPASQVGSQGGAARPILNANAAAALATCTGTSQNGAAGPAVGQTGIELTGAGGGGGASCTASAGGNGGAGSGYGSSGGGGGASLPGFLAGSGGAPGGGAVILQVF